MKQSYFYETREYLKTAEEYLTVNEQLAVKYLLAARPSQGFPLEGYHEVLALNWGKDHEVQILYIVSMDMSSVCLLLVHPKSECVLQDSSAKEIIKRLVVIGAAIKVKNLLKLAIEYIKEEIEEYFG